MSLDDETKKMMKGVTVSEGLTRCVLKKKGPYPEKKVRLVNKEQLNQWMHELRKKGMDTFISQKGKVPGEDGLINIAWKCVENNEVFTLEYEQEH